MEENTSNKIFLVGGIIAVVALALGAYFFFTEKGKEFSLFEKPTVITENIVIPNTTTINAGDARVASGDKYAVSLVPKSKSEEIIVPNAILTLRESYDLAIVEGKKWADDANLAYIKSLGAVTLEGKSSTWQVVIGSKTKKKGYEVIVQGSAVLSQKEVDSKDYGGAVPDPWKDLAVVIRELQSHPLYQNATVSEVNFYYNLDNKKWYYAIATSKGMSSIGLE